MSLEFERIQFIIPSLEKFIIMDFNKKIALQDLKFTFTNVLKIDLFFKITLIFYFQRISFNLIKLSQKKKKITQKLQQSFMKKEHDKILE
ncbi:unnamed protein product [Paramecium primaurelia]|uniref:Uncharacterized protein n=1 Tax=Paramecium primaurelia TaxID=5886 RepID=A0A8S1NDS0_PARPR|nr:unnamed protein product [Paramecium primaurelia]